MNFRQLRLADFTDNWHRHTEDHGVVLTTHPEIFRAAVLDLSCRAAVLKVPEYQAAQDRQAIKQAWNESSHDKRRNIALAHYPKSGFRFSNHTGYTNIEDMIGFDIKKAEELFLELIGFYRDTKPRKDYTYLEVIRNWRNKKTVDRNHDHTHKVINRIFGAGGTILPLTSAGELQVDEANFLFLREGCLHRPEDLTADNENIERYTVAAYSY